MENGKNGKPASAGGEYKIKTCFSISHSTAGEDLIPRLEEEIEKHITTFGVTHFFVGYHGSFDRMAQRALVKAKKAHPQVFAQVVLPYHPEPHKEYALDGLDGTCYPDGQEKAPYRLAIPVLNREMIRQADYLIAFVSYISAGAYKAMEYAQARERRGLLHITNLGSLDW